jgi:AraC family transcriptional regulator of adaptative response/methylated-DNA-[protein]-cysteine methyltransferase
MNDMPESLDDARFAAVLARDAAPACGAFLYAVTSQGIYCRPGCPSPAPLRRHIRFFADWGAAEAAGVRPCKRKRCAPPAP